MTVEVFSSSDLPHPDKVRRIELLKHCECGGDLEYSYSFGRFWSVCKTCSPVTTIDINKLRGRGCGNPQS